MYFINVLIKEVKKVEYFNDDIHHAISKAFLSKSPDPNRYFIYYCNGGCCGLGDRQKAIVGAYLLSILTNRTFGIIHKKPLPLSAIFRPNKINWEIPSSRLKGLSVQKQFTRPADNNFLRTYHDLNLTNFYSKDIIYLQSSYEFVSQIRSHYDTPRILPILMKMSNSEVYYTVLKLLFILSDDLKKDIMRIYKEKIKHRKLVCTHLRMGRNEAIPHDSKPVMPMNETDKVWEFLDQYRNSDKYSIFVATDSDEIRALAEERFQSQNIDVPGNIMHIDFIMNNRTEDTKKLFLEQTLLSRCDILLLTRHSGFSRMAAYIRNSSMGLYCYRNGEIHPCRVDLLEQIYVYKSGLAKPLHKKANNSTD